MSDQGHEWISSYLDGEALPRDRSRGMRKLIKQPEARRRLGRYQLIGDAIRGDLPEHLPANLPGRVRQEIAKVSLASRGRPSGVWHWLRGPASLATGGGALAVLAAAGLFLYVKTLQDDLQVDQAAPVALDLEKDVDTQFGIEEHQQILSYMAAHAEIEPRALMPYAQLANYDE